MPKQLCFTADDELIEAVEELVKKVGHSRSDLLNTLVWIAVGTIKTQKVENYYDLIRAASAGTAVTVTEKKE